MPKDGRGKGKVLEAKGQGGMEEGEKKARVALMGEVLEGDSSKGAVELAQFRGRGCSLREDIFEGEAKIHKESYHTSSGPHPHLNELGLIEENAPGLQPNRLEFNEGYGPDSKIQLIKGKKKKP